MLNFRALWIFLSAILLAPVAHSEVFSSKRALMSNGVSMVTTVDTLSRKIIYSWDFNSLTDGYQQLEFSAPVAPILDWCSGSCVSSTGITEAMASANGALKLIYDNDAPPPRANAVELTYSADFTFTGEFLDAAATNNVIITYRNSADIRKTSAMAFTPVLRAVSSGATTFSVNSTSASSTNDAVATVASRAIPPPPAPPGQNSLPFADAGGDQVVIEGTTVTLNGSNSFDYDEEDTLSFQWVLQTPAGSGASLSSVSAVSPTFTADIVGVYTALLFVGDGTAFSQSKALITVTQTPNSAPIANAGSDKTVVKGSIVSLDGSNSNDADGDALIYKWQLQKPANSVAVLSSDSAVNPTFSADTVGTYLASLVVSDGTSDSNEASVMIAVTAPPNSAPDADAGENQIAQAGDLITLDGSASSDVDGDELAFNWVLDTPDGSNAALSDASASKPSFSANIAGIYTATLIVNDPEGDSDTDSVIVEVAALPNQPPVANAGPDQNVTAGNTVTLNASNSSDADNDALSFAWNLLPPNGSKATLSDSTAAMPTIVTDIAGQYIATLTVDDGAGGTDSDSVTIEVAAVPNQPPVANAGPDQNVVAGDTVTLNASNSSDADNDTLIYAWALETPSGSEAELSGASTATPTFVADTEGQFIATLTVDDGSGETDSDSVAIEAAAIPNKPPVANAGPDQNVIAGEVVTLNASNSSDEEAGNLFFDWELITPANSNAKLSDPTVAGPTFTADVAGQYIATVVVVDSADASDSDKVTVDAVDLSSLLPIARAGADQTVTAGDTVSLNGSDSAGPNNESLTFKWTLVTPEASDAELSDGSLERPTFDTDVSGIYTATLVVTNEAGDSEPDEISITATMPANTIPIANAGLDQTVPYTELVTLDASDSTDADGSPLTFFWTLTPPPGSGAVLSSRTVARPTFQPDLAGIYEAALVVNDGTDDSLVDRTRINAELVFTNVPPIAIAGEDQLVFAGQSVELDGGNSNDEEGEQLTYLWNLSKPEGSGATLSDESSVNPTFIADIPGVYTAELVVSDPEDSSEPDSTVITAQAVVINNPPIANAGTDQAVEINSIVTLDGSNSTDQDGDTLTYTWSLSAPEESRVDLSSTTDVMPTFQPDVAGDYIAQLIVNDGSVDSAAVTVSIVVSPLPQNTVPIADAGADQAVFVDAMVQLDGSQSSDLDDDSLEFRWSFTARPAESQAELVNANSSMPGFTADAAGIYVVQLIVNDGKEDSDATTVTVNARIESVNAAPTANAGSRQTVKQGETVTLDGTSSSDQENDPLTYNWSLLAKPKLSKAVLADATVANPQFLADLRGTYVAQLIVSDGENESDPATTTVIVKRRVFSSRGERLYVNNCAACHGDDASGGAVDVDIRNKSWSKIRRSLRRDHERGSPRYLSNFSIWRISRYLRSNGQ